MMRKPSLLFIGNFLSKAKGSLGPSESLYMELSKELQVKAASNKENKTLRFLDFVAKTLFLNYDIIIIDVYSTSAILFAAVTSRIARFRKRRVFLILHGGGLPDLNERNPIKLKRLFNTAEVIVTPSLFIKNYFEEKGYRIFVISNSIHSGKFPYKKEQIDSFRILWIRGFKDIYNPLMAVRVLELCLEHYPDTSLTMIGPDGGLRRQVEDYIDAKGLCEKVAIIGPVKNDELFHYMHSHAVFINTTQYESFGMAVVEAAAAGIPIVSTCVGELPLMWKNGEEILMTPNNSAEEMAEHVIELFKNKHMAQNLRQSAREKAERYDWNVIKKEWIKLLELS